MATTDRIVWIDAARGVCVLAVVLMHTTLSAYLGHLAPGSSTGFWTWFIDAMTPFRIPGLAMLSGLLLARRIRAGWTDRSVRASVASSYWLYAVWLLAFALFAGLVGSYVWTGPIGTGDGVRWDAYLNQLVVPRTLLWYVFALAVWTALLTTLRRVDPALVLVVLAVVSVCSHYVPVLDDNDQYRNVLRYALFFAIGVYGSSWLRDRVGARHLPLIVGALAISLTTGLVILGGGGDPHVEAVLSVPRDAASAVLLLCVTAVVCQARPVGAALAWVGRRTLPVYVLHGILLEALSYIPHWSLVIDRTVVRSLAPLLVTIAIAVVSIALHELVMRTPARVVFELPRPLRRALLRERA
ncbi:acyltransferase family protein [Microbacterium betulae]|uniref:Acyltransferase family protein n=1 Tax=Microbacterium betulae TaxID=2981139 RepID=A0AA97FIU4_9MICO|nr:acyltransferase family protein [Microbacterium sp. AB]WOF22327.1 acyltransferase family protein [Microbacterium sp. AB]